MIEHFDEHLNIRKLLLSTRPSVVVECGAGHGETTRMLAFMKKQLPFELHVVSDICYPEIPDVIWHKGLSYNILKEFADESLDIVFLDTDHNYWTLKEELLAVMPKIKIGGLVVMHDVETFYHDSGMALAYWDGERYPKEEITQNLKHGGLGDCLIDFLTTHKHIFKLERFLPESNGMAVIKKAPITQAKVLTPGSHPLYAPPRPKEEVSVP